MIKRVATLAMPFIVAAGLAACALVEEERDEAAERLYGRTWVAEEVTGQPAAAGIESSLVVTADGKVNGNAGCNGYFGSVILHGTAMSFGNLGATRRLCPAPASDQESRFLRALDRTRGYRVADDVLVLLDGAGATLARLRANAAG